MWNIVCIGNRNYLVDATNCDEGCVGYEDYLFLREGKEVDSKGFTILIPQISSGAGIRPQVEVRYRYSVETMELFDPEELTLAGTGGNSAPIAIKAPVGKTLTYNGKTQTGVAAGSGYKLNGITSASNAGAYTATAALIDGYVWDDGSRGAKSIRWEIKKADNPLTIKAKKATVRTKSLKKKKKVFAVNKLISFVRKGQGTVTYKKIGGNKKITINKKSGKVTVKKGIKKGRYRVKVKVSAAGNGNFNKAVRTVKFTIRVK